MNAAGRPRAALRPCAPRRARLPSILAIAVTSWALAGPLHAQASTPPPSSPTTAPQSSARQLSSYEQESIQIALAETEGQLEPAPDGKIVEGIDVVPLEVFEQRDGVPLFLNWFHITTQKRTIRREVLLRPGQPYDQALADETERNLRAFSQLSVVLVVPLRGKDERHVRLLVVTKDVWSLRLSWQPTLYNGKLIGLAMQPSETNLLGTTQRVSGNVTFTSRNYWLGGSYFVPRIDGSRIDGYVGANAVFDCASGKLEGATGLAFFGQPLYSSRARWSWRVASSWSNLVRQTVGEFGQAICADPGAPPYPVAMNGDVEEDADTVIEERDVVSVPYRYREDRLRGQFVLTRSFHTVNKLNLSFGVEADQMQLASIDPDPSAVSGYHQRRVFEAEELTSDERVPITPSAWDTERATRVFRTNVLGLNRTSSNHPAEVVTMDRRVSPYVQLHAFENRYLRLINYATLGLQEDVQLGHNVYLRLYPALRPLSSRTLLGMFSSASYTWNVARGFVRAVGSSTLELAADGNEASRLPISGLEQSDALFSGDLHFASPDLGFGRFVAGASLIHAPVRYLQRFAFGLGGTGRLRGYEPTAFLGTGMAVLNSELRSRPVRIYGAYAGLSLFHDVGDASNRLDELELKHGGGVGLRFLFPQLDREVFRVDFGFPLQAHAQGEFNLTAGFHQVFDAPAALPPVLLPQ